MNEYIVKFTQTLLIWDSYERLYEQNYIYILKYILLWSLKSSETQRKKRTKVEKEYQGISEIGHVKKTWTWTRKSSNNQSITTTTTKRKLN